MATEGKRHKRGDKIATLIANFPIEKASIPERVAHLLWEARKASPGEILPKNLVAKAVLGLPKTPPIDSDKTNLISRSVTAARAIMREKYGCSIHTEIGVGIRATTTADDQVSTRVTQAAIALESRARTLAAETSLVDPSEVKNEVNRKWLKNEVIPTVRKLEAEGRLQKLLPPKQEDGE